MPGRRHALLILGIGALFTVRLWSAPGIVGSKWSDVLAEHAGIETVLRRSVLEEGRFPVWNPSMNGGAPAFANPQALTLFPFDLLHLVLPLDRATNLLVVLGTLLGGLTMFLFGRAWLRHPASAFVCAVGYMLSWRFLAMVHAGWLPKLGLYALTPLLFWAVLRLLRPDRKGAVIFALVLGVALAQGDMQQMYYTCLACAGLGVAALGRLPRRERAGFLGRAAAGAVLGLLLAAPVLLPRLEFAALSTRTESSYAFFLFHPPALQRLVTLLDPFDQGGELKEYWENNFYFGLWIYPLALYGLLRARRSALPWLIGALVLMGLCFDTAVLRGLYGYFPGFGLFRIPSRMLLLAQFFWTVLAGCGLDALLGTQPSRRRALAVGLIALLPMLDAGARMLPRLRPLPLAEAFPEHPFHEALQRAPAGSRVAAIGRSAVPYGQAAVFGIDLVNGYASLNLKHFMDYFFLMKHGDPRRIPPGPKVWTDLEQVAREDLLAALDVGYVVANRDLPLESMGFQKLAEHADVPVFELYHGVGGKPIRVWQASRPLGGAFFAASVHRVADETASMEAITRSHSPLQAFVLGFDGKPGWYAGPASARLIHRGLQVYEYEVEHHEPGDRYLILSQVWYPGWTARLEDGAELKLYRTNHALLGALVPPGKHHLTLGTSSPRLWQGLGLFALGLLGMAAVLILPVRKLRTSGTSLACGASPAASAAGTAP